ncbi:ATP-NAD kinase [Sulfodiicoccus acidiphilus]|uniref:ATP-NAD kinase n=1 Tax=Sulfodiicoccus acidiphilus TaxID=1670455 RepID=A0A348B3C7_9CREN|nr:ATP-NAD kinase family protein [Sulfodiicoccus acidiphilus]BBD72679.1 ATP-NAD kinase [Sulfodiicoccus acidiphilus]GGT95544.1 ATP-NAD kinase [Sulfodiicoccus acidiphilus]
MTLKLGFLVNPYAGAGGRVGKKGSDGLRLINPETPNRALRFLQALEPNVKILTPQLKMGEDYVSVITTNYEVLPVGGVDTTAEDTVRAVHLMLEEGVGLIVFQGGDGTAFDVMRGLSERKVPVVGVPGGVKMHSGVFASSPENAARLVIAFLKGLAELVEADVLDADEEAYRRGEYRIVRRGTLTSINALNLLVPNKDELPSEQEELDAVANYILEKMENGVNYIIGPGRTTKRIEELLGIPTNFMSVDVVRDGKLLLRGTTYFDLMRLEGPTKIVVTPIGGQSFLFGRGNQEIGPEILKRVGREGIIVVSSLRKVRSIQCLRVDSGDPQVDSSMKGTYWVIVGYNQFFPIRTC